MIRTSQVVSRFSGVVAQMFCARDELVNEGGPVVLLHSPKSEHGTDDAGSDRMTRSSSCRPARGRRSTTDDLVEVSPTTVKREEHGFIRGRSGRRLGAARDQAGDGVCPPASGAGREFLKRYAPGVLLRVHVKLDEASAADSEACPRIGLRPTQSLRLVIVVRAALNRSRREPCARRRSWWRSGD